LDACGNLKISKGTSAVSSGTPPQFTLEPSSHHSHNVNVSSFTGFLLGKIITQFLLKQNQIQFWGQFTLLAVLMCFRCNAIWLLAENFVVDFYENTHPHQRFDRTNQYKAQTVLVIHYHNANKMRTFSWFMLENIKTMPLSL